MAFAYREAVNGSHLIHCMTFPCITGMSFRPDECLSSTDKHID